MPQIATLTIKGKSGASYKFGVYNINSTWKHIGAVYVVTSRKPNPDGGGTHTFIYVGQTDDLNARHSSHHKQQCFDKHAANCLCILIEEDEEKRLAIEADLLASRHWPCNG